MNGWTILHRGPLDPTLRATLRAKSTIDLDCFGPPSGWPTDLPAAGYAVVRETWAGVDILPGPVTPEQIAALPDPGPNPAVVAAAEKAQATSALAALAGQEVDVAALDARIAALGTWLGFPSTQALSTAKVPAAMDTLAAFYGAAAPTNAQAIAAIRALTDIIAVQRETLLVLADVIRHVAR